MSGGGPVGIVPAAGRATRLPGLAGSKEVVPLGTGPDGTPRVPCGELLRRMRAADVRQAYVVLGEGKWDIPGTLGDGSALGLDLAYLTIRGSPGVPWTVARALPFAGGRTVAFGFPDILLSPGDVFPRLLARLAETGADAALALFPADRPERVDMTEVDGEGRVRGIVIKPAETELELTWLAAAWTERLSRHWSGFVARADASGPELHAGDVLRDAIEHGLDVRGVTFPDGTYRDIGTPEDLAAARGEGGYEPRPTPT